MWQFLSTYLWRAKKFKDSCSGCFASLNRNFSREYSYFLHYGCIINFHFPWRYSICSILLTRIASLYVYVESEGEYQKCMRCTANKRCFVICKRKKKKRKRRKLSQYEIKGSNVSSYVWQTSSHSCYIIISGNHMNVLQ